MMPSDQFVLFYNEIFKFLEKKGPKELCKYYDRVAERQAEFCLPLFKAKGLKGMYEYWERIRIEENCDMEHDRNKSFYHLRMRTCPSLSKALKSATGPCRVYCDHCPGWVLTLFAKTGFYGIYDIVGRTTPCCETWVFRNRVDAEAKFSERLAMSGADLVSTNMPLGMVRGTLAGSERFEGLHPRFGKAFAFLRSRDLAKLPPGRIDIDGDAVYANVIDTTLKPWDADAQLEQHRAYFDIHVPVSGEEIDGYIYDEAGAKANAAAFNVEKDYVLFRNPKMAKVALKPGEFAIFHPPYGAHAPNKTEGAPRPHRKIVIKVKA